MTPWDAQFSTSYRRRYGDFMQIVLSFCHNIMFFGFEWRYISKIERNIFQPTVTTAIKTL